MGAKQVVAADSMSRLADAATRLRQVREAQRYFLDLWAMEHAEKLSRRNRRRFRTRVNRRASLPRRIRFLD
jgi:hypothetical protein